jgi:hypothetical protein
LFALIFPAPDCPELFRSLKGRKNSVNCGIGFFVPIARGGSSEIKHHS